VATAPSSCYYLLLLETWRPSPIYPRNRILVSEAECLVVTDGNGWAACLSPVFLMVSALIMVGLKCLKRLRDYVLGLLDGVFRKSDSAMMVSQALQNLTR
jgi:hypothetical protein